MENRYDAYVERAVEKYRSLMYEQLERADEIKRVKEYARLADNCDNVQSEVAELLEIYNISEEDINHESIS